MQDFAMFQFSNPVLELIIPGKLVQLWCRTTTLFMIKLHTSREINNTTKLVLLSKTMLLKCLWDTTITLQLTNLLVTSIQQQKPRINPTLFHQLQVFTTLQTSNPIFQFQYQRLTQTTQRNQPSNQWFQIQTLQLLQLSMIHPSSFQVITLGNRVLLVETQLFQSRRSQMIPWSIWFQESEH